MIRRQKTGICMEADWLQEGLIIRIGDLQAGDVVQVFWRPSGEESGMRHR
jgi:hypothetical protein